MDKRIAIGGGGLILLLVALAAYPYINLHESITRTDTTVDMDFTLPENSTVALVIIGADISSADLDGESIGGYLSPIMIQDFEVGGIQYGSGDELYDLDMGLYSEIKEEFGPGTVFYAVPAIESTAPGQHRLVLNMPDTRNCRIFQYTPRGLREVKP